MVLNYLRSLVGWLYSRRRLTLGFSAKAVHECLRWSGSGVPLWKHCFALGSWFCSKSWFRSRRVLGKMEFLTAGWSALSGKNRCGFLGHFAAGIVCKCLQAHCWSCAARLHACLLSLSHLVFPSQGLARHGFHAVGCSVTVVLERESALQTTVTLQSQWHYSQRLKGWAKEKIGANN